MARHAGVDPGQGLDGTGGREPGQGAELGSQVEIFAEQVRQAQPTLQDLTERQLQDLEGEAPRRPLFGCGVGEVQE